MHSDLQDVRVLLRPYSENKPHIIVERQNYGLNLLNLQYTSPRAILRGIRSDCIRMFGTLPKSFPYFSNVSFFVLLFSCLSAPVGYYRRYYYYYTHHLLDVVVFDERLSVFILYEVRTLQRCVGYLAV